MSLFEKKNNARGFVLDNPLSASATTLNLNSGEGANFPSSGTFIITIWNAEGYPNPTDDANMEIVWCTSRTDDALTIVRGKEDTSGVEHALNSRVEMLMTAGHYTDPDHGIEDNLKGDTGDQGDTGPGDIGDTGIQGDTGDIGDTGIQGDQGDTGVVGDTGADSTIPGDTGIQGNTGNIGDTGSQGNAGDTGDIGDTGADSTIPGDTGIQGDTGSQGVEGDTGTQGDTGSQGNVGDTGVEGDTGIQGDIGITGDTGADSTIPGDTGIVGDTGTQGDTGSTGAVGDTGEVGDTGADSTIPGDTGITGDQGDTGITGDTGTQGDQGDTGDEGDTGADSTIPGDTGIEGDTGITGDTGTTGAVGDTGDQGDTGVEGDTGTTGSAPTGQLFLSAAGGWPSTTNGCADNTKLELETNDVDVYHLAFDTATDEFAQWSVVMPSDWDGGTVTATFYWMHPATTTNFGVAFFCQARSYANDEALDQAFGTAVGAVDTGGTTSDLYISPATAAITIAGATASEFVQFRVYRDISDGGDTLAVDAFLLGIMITFTRT